MNIFPELSIYEYVEGAEYQHVHLKRDGYSIQFSKDKQGEVSYNTRTPTYFSHHPQNWFKELVEKLPNDTIILGELFVDGGFATDVRSVLSRNPSKEGLFECYAVYKFDGVDFRNKTFEEYESLCEQWELPFIQKYRGDLSKIPDGYEGFVFKTNQFPRFVRDWMKYKPKQSIDLRVTGFEWAKAGKFFGLIGSIKCETDDKSVVATVSGIDLETRRHMTKNPEFWIGKVIEVSYQIKGSKGGLRSPNFERLRDDKDTTN